MSQNWPLRPSRNSEAGGSRRKYPRCAEWQLPSDGHSSDALRALACAMYVFRREMLAALIGMGIIDLQTPTHTKPQEQRRSQVSLVGGADRIPGGADRIPRGGE